MRRYPAYKDSGFEWLGEVPVHWVVKPIKHLVAINPDTLPEDTSPDFEIEYIDIGNVSSNGLINLPQKMTFGDAPSRARRIVQLGDTIISTVRTYLKAVAFIDAKQRNLIASTGFAVLRSHGEVDSRFLRYAVLCHSFVEAVTANSVGVSYPAINSSTFGRLKLPYPPLLGEQQAIADFLDKKTAAIDQFLTAKRRLITLLEEQKQAVINTAVTQGLDAAVSRKPSGLDWLGDIPTHWQCLQIKRCLQNFEYGISVSLSGSGRYKVLTMGHIQDGQVIIPDEGCLQEKPELILDNGDLLFNRTNSPELVGKVGLFRGSSSDEISFASYLVRLKPKADVVSEYLNYLLNSSAFINNARRNALVSLHQANLNPTKYSRMLIPMPPYDEQLKIAQAINNKTAAINTAITHAQRHITLMEEYRTALIAQAVTGHIDVRPAI